MKLARTVIFILVFAFAAGVYLFQVRLAKQTLTNVPDEVNRDVTISQKDVIDRMTLRDNVRKTQIGLRKAEGSWNLDVPVPYPAESRIVEGLAAAARMASRQPRLRAEKEWAEYGLARPDMEITFGLPGAKEVVLLIGMQAPVGKAVYARWTEERGYFLLPSEVKSAFQQSVYGLREKRIFRASPDTFRKIFVEMGEHSYQWKKDGEDWYWFEPVSRFGQKVPLARVNAVVAVLQNLYVKEFQDNNKRSRAELGFFMIHDRIRVESAGMTESFHFGNEVPERDAYYGFREGESTVFLVDRGKVIELFELMKNISSGNLEQGAGATKVLPSSDKGAGDMFPGRKIQTR